jgi:U3 small nucleolar ribonucleoprotein component
MHLGEEEEEASLEGNEDDGVDYVRAKEKLCI